MKLPEARNYAWQTTVVDDARTYDVSGQTDRGTDFSLVTMPMVTAVRRRTGRSGGASDNVGTILFKGAEKWVVQTDEGWRSPSELVSPMERGRGPGGSGGFGGQGGFGGAGGSRRPRGAGPGRGDGDGANAPAYSNLQKTLSRPHEEVGIIIAGYTEIKVEGEVASGPLSETAAMLLLVHPGQNEITPLSASGSFRMWVRDGVLSKFETKLEGKLSVQTSAGRREVTVHQTATTIITNVGATKFDVPAEAKQRLGD